MKDNFLSKEDYEEPCCPLNMEPDITHIPVARVIEKEDEYLSMNDYTGAERHLRYWLAEAEAGNDKRGKLTVLNELIGLFRKLGKEPEGTAAIREALALAEELELGNTVSYGTTLINAATGYRAFGKAEEALPLYRKARALYESAPNTDSGLLAGLYNNMAVTLTELRRFDEAEPLFRQALDLVSAQSSGELEAAVTWLNIADLLTAKLGPENAEKSVGDCLDRAEELFESESLTRNGTYAFYCDKCASVFSFYGRFRTEQKLKERAKEIYERA